MTGKNVDLLSDKRVYPILKEIAERGSIKITDIEGELGCWRTLYNIITELEDNGVVRSYLPKRGRMAQRYEFTEKGYVAFLFLDMGNSMLRGTFDIERNDITDIEDLVSRYPTSRYRNRRPGDSQ